MQCKHVYGFIAIVPACTIRGDCSNQMNEVTVTRHSQGKKKKYPYDSTFYTMDVTTHYFTDRPLLVDRLRGAAVCLGLQLSAGGGGDGGGY